MKHSIILASMSPRRYSLLHAIGFKIQVIHPQVDESQLDDEKPEEMVLRLAKLKAMTVEKVISKQAHPKPIIAADSIICLDDQNILEKSQKVLGKPQKILGKPQKVLGKPKDASDAIQTLKLLSNREHQVLTGYYIKLGDKEKSGYVATTVSFRKLSLDEIKAYVETGEPLDKAGSYAIQAGGASFVDQVTGSFTNIIGLPVKEVLEALEALEALESYH